MERSDPVFIRRPPLRSLILQTQRTYAHIHSNPWVRYIPMVDTECIKPQHGLRGVYQKRRQRSESREGGVSWVRRATRGRQCDVRVRGGTPALTSARGARARARWA